MLLDGIDFAELFINFLVLLFSLSVHESAHAWSADRLGDPTGRLLGRISLNPAVHADPIGTILLPLVAFMTRLPFIIGWARPVPVNPLNLKNFRRDFLFIAAAGPASNLVLAILAAITIRLLPAPAPFDGVNTIWLLWMILVQAVQLNLVLAVFNMIPIPPLDGGNVLAGLLPSHMADQFDRIRPYGFLLIFGLMLTGLLQYVIAVPYIFLRNWLLL